MKKLLLIAKHEFITNFTRKSFLFTAFGMPLIGILIMAGLNLLGNRSPDALSTLTGTGQTDTFLTEGYIDQGDWIAGIPETVPDGALVEYTARETAEADLAAGKISGFYLLEDDMLETAEVKFISDEVSPINSSSQFGFMVNTIRYNLLDEDLQLMTLIDTVYFNYQPQEVKTTVSPENNALAFIVPYATVMIFYFVILMSASMLLQSISKEKQNRIIEVLMSTVSPLELLIGKLLGLGLLGLVQTGFWIGSILTYLSVSSSTLDILSRFNLNPGFLLWALVFFIGGYGVYASLMAGMGALVPNIREASQATIVVIFPLIIPLFFISLIIEDPHGTFSTVLSLVPFTAPIVMPSRLAVGGVEWWQIALAVALLFGTAYIILNLIARMFRAQTLLSGEAFSVKRFISALAGRLN